MEVRKAIATTAGLLVGIPLPAGAQTSVQSLPFEKLAAECAPDIHPTTLKAVVSTESAWNPYAIGVVGGRLERQPRSLAEAVATARNLERQGFNFSMGLGQVNRYNLPKYGETYETVFEPCRNIKVGSAILKGCFERAKAKTNDDQQALRAAFSCYYSGNFTRGLRPDKAGEPSYAQKVVANATSPIKPLPAVPAIESQNTDAAVPVRVAGRSVGKAVAKPIAKPQWVIFIKEPQHSGQGELASSGSDGDVAVKVRMVPSGSEATLRPVANSERKDAPFVQFMN